MAKDCAGSVAGCLVIEALGLAGVGIGLVQCRVCELHYEAAPQGFLWYCI